MTWAAIDVHARSTYVASMDVTTSDLTVPRMLANIRRRLVPALRARDSEEVNHLANLANAQRDERTEAAIDLGTKDCGK
jgi:hypothetical protein